MTQVFCLGDAAQNSSILNGQTYVNQRLNCREYDYQVAVSQVNVEFNSSSVFAQLRLAVGDTFNYDNTLSNFPVTTASVYNNIPAFLRALTGLTNQSNISSASAITQFNIENYRDYVWSVLDNDKSALTRTNWTSELSLPELWSNVVGPDPTYTAGTYEVEVLPDDPCVQTLAYDPRYSSAVTFEIDAATNIASFSGSTLSIGTFLDTVIGVEVDDSTWTVLHGETSLPTGLDIGANPVVRIQKVGYWGRVVILTSAGVAAYTSPALDLSELYDGIETLQFTVSLVNNAEDPRIFEMTDITVPTQSVATPTLNLTVVSQDLANILGFVPNILYESASNQVVSANELRVGLNIDSIYLCAPSLPVKTQILAPSNKVVPSNPLCRIPLKTPADLLNLNDALKFAASIPLYSNDDIRLDTISLMFQTVTSSRTDSPTLLFVGSPAVDLWFTATPKPGVVPKLPAVY